MGAVSRRKFLCHSGLAVTAWSLPNFHFRLSPYQIQRARAQRTQLTAAQLAKEESFWALVREAFSVSPTLINLNNGGVSPQPLRVQEMQNKYNAWSNEAPSYYMWRNLDAGREALRTRLAQLGQCDPEELAICRNATEALNICIHGIDLQRGDEVVLSYQDYPNMINAWKQRAQREGIVLRWVDLNLPAEDDTYFVKSYAQWVGPRTKVVHLTHMINWTGQIVPVRKVADEVRKINPQVFVICDAAHTFAHLNYRIADLGCDGWGASLHKWLCAPFGTGLLWIRRNRIADVWPIFAPDQPRSSDIRKFEAQGTRSFPAEQAIGYAIDFHEAIGADHKEARLRFLKNYWCTRVEKLPGVRLVTSLKADYACALAGVQLAGVLPTQLEAFLLNKYRIHTVAIQWHNISCVRITPHVYTTLRELDRLVVALTDAATNGVSH